MQGVKDGKIFGAVSDGEKWVFLKCENQKFSETKHYKAGESAELEEILGTLRGIVREMNPNLE